MHLHPDYAKPSSQFCVTLFVPSFCRQNGVLAHPEATYLVNGEFQPTFNLKPGETKWVQFLLATAENLVGFQLINSETNETFPVWDIASDGINYEKPIVREQYVQGGGMRQGTFLVYLHPHYAACQYWPSSHSGDDPYPLLLKTSSCSSRVKVLTMLCQKV
jgi:hypothetical protein